MKTGRFLGWVAMATMVLSTGCSNDEVVNDFSQDNAIEFATYVERNAVSRATVIDDAKLATDGFGVFAYYTGQTVWKDYTSKTTPNFMNNEEVKDERDPKTSPYQWTYSPVKYWPNNVDDKVSFFAYAPYTTTFGTGVTPPTTNVTGFNGTLTQGETNPAGPYVSFTMDTDVKAQQDLLWAAPHIDKVKNASPNSTGGVTVEDKIKFEFKHALAKIGFKVQAMVDKVNEDDNDAAEGKVEEDNATDQTENIATGTTIEVKKVTLSGDFYKSGVLNLNPIIAETGTSQTVTGLWSNQANYIDDDNWTGYVLSTITAAAEGTTEVTNFMRTTTTTGEGESATTETKKHEIVTTTETQLNAEDSYIMVIPKDFPSTGDDKIKIEVVYTVTTTDSNLSTGSSIITNTIASEFNGINFEAGKAYTFCLHLGMTSVKFEAEVKGWEEASEWAVNVPLNTTTPAGGTGDDDTND